ncbi:MAG TPA: ABC transporter substrate-binding protein [Negativicutes bacterium]|nr:ABC transporter substrate-binding protein [Negativicutes bacterium]
MNKKVMSKVLITVLLVSLVASGCTNDTRNNAAVINIAEQYGFAYAPLQIARELKLIEKNLPGATVNWKQLGNTTAIREAMLASEVDVGFMAIPPFLIGWDKGMDWKIACGLSSSPVALVTNKEEISSIRDIGDKDRIALPQPGSVQHILLSMACERELGDAKKLDNLLVTMAHPDGMNALLAGKEITAHFTTPPYLLKELQVKGMHEILNGKQALGKDFTFIAGVTTRKFHDEKPKEYEAVMKAVAEAMEYMKDNRKEAAEILSRQYEMSVEEVEKNLSMEGMDYSLSVKGVNDFADFMERNGYISKSPGSIKEIVWDEKNYED